MFRRVFAPALVVVLLASLPACSYEPPGDVADAMTRIPDRITYNEHVRPILSDRCFKCHGPDGAARATDMRLDNAEGARIALRASTSVGSHAIEPGDPAGSEMVRRILSDDPAYHMPPPDSKLSLTDEEKAILIRWIDQGAEYEPHWAFIPPVSPDLPEPARDEWARDPLDRFVADRLEREGLEPSPEADRETWLRRVTLDLTGMGPTIQEMDEFLADGSTGAYEHVVDRLLASPAYGEHMASSWLDLARYADSHGYQDDGWRTMWPWRDWVVSAQNRNLPYDEFVTWQLAGDLLPDPTTEQILATGFNRNHLQSQEGGIVAEEYRVDYVADRTNTFGRAFLGLTVECSRCHAHKYDPISQEEYYGLFAFFNSVNEFGNIPYAGEASPVVILTDSVTDARLAQIHIQTADAERELAARPEAGFDAWVAGSAKGSGIPVTRASVGRPGSSVGRPGSSVRRARRSAAGSVGDVPGLVGHYPLDGFVETKDRMDLPDLVSPSKPGYFWGDRDKLPEIIDGVVGKGMRLRGDGWLDMGNKRFYFERNQPFSLGLWTRISSDSVSGPLFGKSGGLFNGKRGYLVILNEDGTLSASLNHVFPDNSIEIRTTGRVPSGDWHHVAMTYDGSSRASGIRLYLDGDRMEATTVVNNLRQSIRVVVDPETGDSTNWGGSGNLSIGFEGGNLPTTEGVDVDEFRIFKRQLASLEVAAEAGAVDTVATLLAQGSAGLTDAQRAALREYWSERVDPGAREIRTRLEGLRGEENAILTGRTSVMVMRDLSSPRPTHVLHRGAYDAPAEPVEPMTPAAVLPFPEELPKNRLGLARWLFDERNPVTARVAVNRYWQQLFGRGIVATVDNVGFQGMAPSHPELLDHLATRFRATGWDVKGLLKAIVLSATYRQSSVAAPDMIGRDPDNILLARGPSARLPAETVRDAALAASGLLVRTIGGPPVKPYQPKGLWKELATRNATEYVQDHGDKLYRRSLYTIWKRTTPPPSMINFDAAERNICIVQRQRTNTPLQALVLMNDPQYIEAARFLAERSIREAGPDVDSRIERIFRLLTGRRPDPEEKRILRALHDEEMPSFRSAPADADLLLATGEKPRDPGLDRVEVASLTVIASAVMNFDAFVTKR